MDPFSAEGELTNIHNAFHQGQYTCVKDFDASSLSPSNHLPARILALRSRIQLGESAAVIKEIESEAASSSDLAAVLLLAQYVASLDDEGVKEKAVELAKSEGDNLSVQLCVGTVLAGCGETEEALGLLVRHQGSLDAVALIVQIHLAQNRLDLAQSEVRKARAWAQDNLLVNLAEAWVGLREGGSSYQSAFYVFEELATTPSTSSTRSLLAQSIAELHLGRTPEAEAAMNSALEGAPEDADVLANAVVLYTILGKEMEREEMRERLQKAAPGHRLLVEAQERKSAFESARAKYNPRFEIEAS